MRERRSVIECRGDPELSESPDEPRGKVRSAPRRRCVLLFARSPEQEGKLKASRGVPGGAALFRFARSRVVEAVGSLAGVDLILIGDGPVPEGAVRALPQHGATFGDRLQNAFRDVRDLGYEQIVAVPSDVPSLDREFLLAAFARLDATRVVLGPCADGGVYLIGFCGFDDSLLQGVRWRTRFVARDLVRRAAGTALLLPLLVDVDDERGYAALAATPGLDAGLSELLAQLGSTSRLRDEWIRFADRGPARGALPARGPPA
jgi:hypothetical protein